MVNKLKCNVCESNVNICYSNVLDMYVCKRHHAHGQLYGMIRRSYIDGNEIIQYDDYAEIILYKLGIECSRSKISISDIDMCKDIWWSYRVHGYVASSKNKYLHRYLMSCPDNLIVDHINGDRLDNRRENLRIVERAVNNLNRIDDMTGIYHRTKNSWEARINLDGKTVYRKFFRTVEEAKSSRKFKLAQIINNKLKE